MDAIRRYLQDPSWWFAAVFVGILASLLAGYLKDLLSLGVASISTRYRAAKAKRDDRTQRWIHELAQNETLLVLIHVRAYGQLLVFAAMVIMYTVVAVALLLIRNDHGNRELKVQLTALVIFSATAAGYLGFTAISLFRMAQRTRAAYRQSFGLPR